MSTITTTPAPTKAQMLAKWREYRRALKGLHKAQDRWYGNGPSYGTMIALRNWGNEADRLICEYSNMDQAYAAAHGASYLIPDKDRIR